MSAFNSGTISTNFSGTIGSLDITSNNATTSTNTGALIVSGGIGAQAIYLQSETVGNLVVTNSASIANLCITTAVSAASLWAATNAGTVAGLQISGTAQKAPKIWLTGSDYTNGVATGSTSGIAIILNVNNTNNKQLGLIDTEYIGSTSATVPILRLATVGSIAYLDAIAADATTLLPIYINSNLYPYIDNSRSLGSSTLRYSGISSVTGSIANLKTTTATIGGLYVSNDIRSSAPNYFQWYASGTSNYQTISNSTIQVIAQFTGNNSSGNIYSALGGYSGILNVFYTGVHFVSANIRFSASALGYRQVLIYQNIQLAGGTYNVTGGSVLAEAVIPVSSSTNVTDVSLSAMCQLNSGDTVSIAVAQSSGGNLNLDGSIQNNFAIFRIV